MAGLDGQVFRSGKFWCLFAEWVSRRCKQRFVTLRRRGPSLTIKRRFEHKKALSMMAFIAMARSEGLEDSGALEFVLANGVIAFICSTVLGMAYLCGYSELVRTCNCGKRQGEFVYYVFMAVLSFVALLCGLFAGSQDTASEFSTAMTLFLCVAYALSAWLTRKEAKDYETSFGNLASQAAPLPA